MLKSVLDNCSALQRISIIKIKRLLLKKECEAPFKTYIESERLILVFYKIKWKIVVNFEVIHFLLSKESI